MRLDHLSLTTFRSHYKTEFEPAPLVNLLHGDNGAGKTNILESIGYLGLGKSFLGVPDSTVVHRGADHFVVDGTFFGDARGKMSLRIASVPGDGRRAFSNGAPLDRLSDLVGRVPIVTASPLDYELTAGGPGERRRFLDVTLSQSYPAYLKDVVSYRRALKQKSALLGKRRGRPVQPQTISAWDNEIATIGGRIVERRKVFLARFSSFLSDAFGLIGSTGDEPSLVYQPAGITDADEPAESALRIALDRTFKRSVQTGQTYAGPHRDEVAFFLGDLEVRPYASQGQHRTFSLCLRIAQALFLRESTDELPLLLLDDVFGPLDPKRTQIVLELLAGGSLGQSFVSSADHGPIQKVVPFSGDQHAMFHVERGALAPS